MCARVYLCTQVDELSIIDASELAVNSMPDICENPRIQSQLAELSNAELNTRLVARQGLAQVSQRPLVVVEHFDDDHPLEDDDCIIPEDQEAQLEAQDGWGVPTQKQKSDSQLIAENGSEPESQGMGAELSLTTAAPVRVEATDQSQGAGVVDGDDESVPDSQGFHFQNENIEETFVQCSDTESEEERSTSARDRVSQESAATRSTSSQLAVSIETTTPSEEVAVPAVATSSAPPASTPKKKRFKIKKKVRLSQQSTRSDVDSMHDADELHSGAERERMSVADPFGDHGFPQTQASESQEGFAEPEDTTTDPNESSLTQMSEENTTQVDVAKRQVANAVVVSNEKEAIEDHGADRSTQQVDPLAESQDASGGVFVHVGDSQDEPLTQAPGDHLMHAGTQDEAEADEGSSQVERSSSFGVMDEGVWHTQPNEDSQVFGFASQSQSEREQGSGLQSIQNLIGAEPLQPLARVTESTEEPEFGAGDSFADDEENHRQLDNQSQPDSDDHQQSENLLSPKVVRKQAESDSTRLQSDQLAKNLRLSPVARVSRGSPARPNPPSQPQVVDLTSPAHSERAPPNLSGQKRPLGSVAPDHPSGPQPSTAEASVSSNASRQRKAPRRSESLSASVLAASRKGSGQAHFRGVPLSIQQRTLQQYDDPTATPTGGTSSNASGGESVGSLFTLLRRLQHGESTQQSTTSSVSSRRRVNAPSSSESGAVEMRPSKRYEHLFPPLRMGDLDKIILERFGKSKKTTRKQSM